MSDPLRSIEERLGMEFLPPFVRKEHDAQGREIMIRLPFQAGKRPLFEHQGQKWLIDEIRAVYDKDAPEGAIIDLIGEWINKND